MRLPGPESAFGQRGHGALNLLGPSFPFTGRLSDKTYGVTAQNYPTSLQREIDMLVGQGGMALDFGAAFKCRRPVILLIRRNPILRFRLQA